MLVYSVIYLLLAIYIERINPGEFGVAQPWNYLFKRYYWKPQATAVVQPGETDGKLVNGNERVSDRNVWIELGGMSTTKSPSLSVSHLTKVIYLDLLFHMFIFRISLEIWQVHCSF